MRFNRHNTRRRCWTAAGVGLIVAAATGTGWGVASAASPGPVGGDGRVNACYTADGALKLQPAGTACAKSKTAISWVGTIPNAVVFSDGTLLHESGVSQVTHPAIGLYDVYFSDANAGGCAQVASLADMTPGVIAAYGGQVAPNVVQVQTADTSGNPADRTFQVMLAC